MQNYFEIFDLEQNFEIDKIQLKQSFNQQIIQFHPDKFINQPSKQQLEAMQNTITLNNTFAVLNDDVQRANYLLKLNNINAFDEKDTKMNKDFLISQIEFQEQLENVKTELELNNFIDNISNLIKNNIIKIKLNFIKNKLIVVKNLLRELKFYQQLLQKSKDLDF